MGFYETLNSSRNEGKGQTGATIWKMNKALWLVNSYVPKLCKPIGAKGSNVPWSHIFHKGHHGKNICIVIKV